MAIKINNVGENIFPHVEEVEANPAIGGGCEVILHTRIEGRDTPVVIKLTDTQARKLYLGLSLGPRY